MCISGVLEQAVEPAAVAARRWVLKLTCATCTVFETWIQYIWAQLQIHYGKISIIMMKAEFTGWLELLFSAVLVGQREAQTAQCYRSAHCSPDDYLMSCCFAFSNQLLSTSGTDRRRRNRTAHSLHCTQGAVIHTVIRRSATPCKSASAHLPADSRTRC